MTGSSATADPEARPSPTLILDGRPPTRWAWLREVVAFWPVLDMLARKEFKTRYRGAAFGVMWAIAVPLLQAAVIATVFSLFVRFEVDGGSYAAYVLSGMLSWSYFAITVLPGTTAIVDGVNLVDKVWFPRILLVLVLPLANLVGLVVTHVVLLFALPLFGVSLTPRLLVLPLAGALLVLLTSALVAVLSAMHVYFRDTKFFVQASLLVWIYLTPVIYPAELLGRWKGWVDLNPMTGVVALTRYATLGTADWSRSVACSIAITVVLLIVAVEIHRRHDRRFVDLL